MSNVDTGIAGQTMQAEPLSASTGDHAIGSSSLGGGLEFDKSLSPGLVRDLINDLRSTPVSDIALRSLATALVDKAGYTGAAIIKLAGAGDRPHVVATAGMQPNQLEVAIRWSHLATRKRESTADPLLHPTEPLIVVRLEGRSRLLGVLALWGSDTRSRFDKDRPLLSLLGTAIGLIQEQDELEVVARSSRDARLRQLEFLVTSAQAISSSLEIEQVCGSVLSALQELLSARAGWIALYRPSDDSLQMVSYRGLGRDRLASIRLSAGQGVAWRVLRSQKAWLVPDVQKEAAFAYPDAAQRAGLRTMLAVPLLSRSEAIGVLGAFLPRMPSDSREQVAILETAEIFANQAAAAIQNARLFHEVEESYARELRIAETFQQAILADVTMQLPGLDIGHTYRAALNEAVVGGDFYDVFPLPDGRIALMIGDVSGKGLNAAVQTARVKFSARGFALEDATPERVMERVDHALRGQGAHGGFVSLFLAIYDPKERCLEYANGGHEPPLLYRANGEAERLPRTATVVGLDIPVSFTAEQRKITISPGDTLVLYTDGLTEARRHRRFLERHGLLELWKKAARLNPQQASDALVQSVDQYSLGRLKDDVAVLVVRFQEAAT